MKHISIALKLAIAFSVLIALFLVQGGISLWVAEKDDAHMSEMTEASIPGLESILGITNNMRQIIALQHIFLYPSLSVGQFNAAMTDMENIRKKLAEEMNVPLLGQIPLVQSICESGDNGAPVALNEDSVTGRSFLQLAAAVVRQVDRRNVEMAPTHIVEVHTGVDPHKH